MPLLAAAWSAATGDIQGAKDLLMILGEHSDSILRLAGKLRDIEANLEVKRDKDGKLELDKNGDVISGITYEHTLEIKDLRTQIEALLDIYEKDGNLNKLEKNSFDVIILAVPHKEIGSRFKRFNWPSRFKRFYGFWIYHYR